MAIDPPNFRKIGAWFHEFMIAARGEGNVALLMCTRKSDGKRVPMVCLIKIDPDQPEVCMVRPYAELLTMDDPLEDYDPPQEFRSVNDFTDEVNDLLKATLAKKDD